MGQADLWSAADGLPPCALVLRELGLCQGRGPFPKRPHVASTSCSRVVPCGLSWEEARPPRWALRPGTLSRPARTSAHL